MTYIYANQSYKYSKIKYYPLLCSIAIYQISSNFKSVKNKKLSLKKIYRNIKKDKKKDEIC